MSNSVFAFPDRTLTATLSGGTWDAVLKLDNLKIVTPSKKARSTGKTTGATQFVVTFGSAQKVNVVALVGHNAHSGATCRIVFKNGGTTVLDTTALTMFPQFWPTAILGGATGFWDGELIKDDAAAGYRPDYWYYSATPLSVTSVEVYVDDSGSGNTDNYFELGRCFIAPAIQPLVNILYGAGIQWGSETRSQRAIGGNDFFDIRQGRKTITGTLELTEEEGMLFGFYRNRRLDIWGDMYFVFNPADVYGLYRQRSMLCRNKEINPLEFPYVDGTTQAFQLEEIL